MKMTKAQKQYQAKVNERILSAIDELCDYTSSIGSVCSCHRLRYCKAWVNRYDDYIVLISYNTVVAFIDRKNMILYDILRSAFGYTSTSAQHIAKFRSDFRNYFREELRYYPC